MGIKSSHFIALCITVGLGIWMFSGEVVISGIGNGPAQASDTRESPEAAKPSDASEDTRFRVRTQHVKAQERQQTLTIRGRTQALSRVGVRAETAGVLVRRAFKKGQRVERNDVLCALDEGARAASVTQAKTALEKAQRDLDVALGLQKKGYMTATQVRASRAATDGAKAALEQAELELSRILVRAPISGTIIDPVAEQGDRLAIGALCATIVSLDPMLFVGQVAERDLNVVKTGMTASVIPIGGKAVMGKITYVSPSAEESTRTFRVEATIPNDARVIADGITARAIVTLAPKSSHLLPQSALVLADDGRVGARVVAQGKAMFVPLTILSDARDGVWVSGLPEDAEVIVVGQHYVVDAQPVLTVPVSSQESAPR